MMSAPAASPESTNRRMAATYRNQKAPRGGARSRLRRLAAQLSPPTAEQRCAAAVAVGGDSNQECLRVAPFQFHVTPPIGTPLMDGGVTAATEVLTPLTARGVVLLGVEGGPVILCAVDWVGISNESHDRLRGALARGCDTAPSRVALHTIHQHDAPGSDSATDRLLQAHGLPGISMVEPFLPEVSAQFEAATRQAVAAGGGTPVTHVGAGSAVVERVASNRHIMGDDGLVAIQRQSSTGGSPEAAAAPEGLVDPLLKVLGLWHNHTVLASLSFYATHPMCNYGEGQVQWDFMGIAREQFEQTGLLGNATAVHFTGAGGNVAAGKYNDGQPQRKQELAGRVATAMVGAWRDASAHRRPITAAEVAWHAQPVALPLKPSLCGPEPPLLARIDDTSNGKGNVHVPEAVYPRIAAAQDVIFARRCKAGATVDVTCLTVGDAVRVVGMPGEPFVEYQLAAQAMASETAAIAGGSNPTVMMAAYGDMGPSYIGTAASYSYGPHCYETSGPSRTTADAEPLLLDAIQCLLDKSTGATTNG